MLPEQYLGPRIRKISNAMDRKRNLDLQDMDLTSSQGMVLGYLARSRGRAVSPGELGSRFGLTHPTVTGILQRLQAKGFIRCEEDPADRRKKRVAATEKALCCHEHIVQRFLQTEAQLTDGLSPSEQETLLALLDRVIANIEPGCACRRGAAQTAEGPAEQPAPPRKEETT